MTTHQTRWADSVLRVEKIGTWPSPPLDAGLPNPRLSQQPEFYFSFVNRFCARARKTSQSPCRGLQKDGVKNATHPDQIGFLDISPRNIPSRNLFPDRALISLTVIRPTNFAYNSEQGSGKEANFGKPLPLTESIAHTRHHRLPSSLSHRWRWFNHLKKY